MTASLEIIGCSKFPHVLHRMLEDAKDDADLAKVVSWMPVPITSDEHDGSTSISNSFLMDEYNVSQCYCFKVHNNKEFCATVMPTYFTHQTRYKSFLRQLNMYGITRITKVGPNHGAYFHPLLAPGKAYLLDKIPRVHKRGPKSTTKATNAPLPRGQNIKDSLLGLIHPINHVSEHTQEKTRFKHLQAAINGSSNSMSPQDNSNPIASQATFSFKPYMLNSQQPITARSTTESRSLLGKEFLSLPALSQKSDDVPFMKPSLTSLPYSKTTSDLDNRIGPIYAEDHSFGNNGSGSTSNKVSQSVEPIHRFQTKHLPHMTPREDNDSSSISLSGGVLPPQHSILRDHFSLSRINQTLNDMATPTPMDPQNRTSSTSSSSLPRPWDHFFTDDVADDIVALFRTDGDVNSTASNAATNAATPTDGLDELARSWEV